MNTFIVICKDKENALGKRLANRNFHLKYLQTLKEKLVMAGPILDDSENPNTNYQLMILKNFGVIKHHHFPGLRISRL